MAKRMTTEEKIAARERRDAEYRRAEQRRQIDEFKQRRDEARARKVYSDEAAWNAPEAEGRVGGALWEMVRQLRSLRETFTRDLRRMTERIAETQRRMDEGRTGSGYSTVLGDGPADIEQTNAKIETLREGIRWLAYANGWYVADIESKKTQEWRALLVSIDVVTAPVARWNPYAATYVVRSMQDQTPFYLSIVDGVPSLTVVEADAMTYDNEDAAWLAALTFVGDGRWL